MWSLSKNWALIHLFTELDKAMVHVIRLAGCLWLWFHSVCPLMPSLSDYRLAWVSLTLDVRYFFAAAPAKRSRRSSPWTWRRSSLPCSCAVRLVKAVVFPVVMYGCESWTIKKAERSLWCFWTVVLEKTPESPLDCKEIQPVHAEGDQSWVFIGRTDAEAETPILWPPDAKSWLIWKNPDAGKDWGQEEKGMTEDEMVGWHHRLDGHGVE